VTERLTPGSPLPTKWIVITGAPSSGKTTTMELLAERGFIVSPDSTRALIARVVQEGRDAEEFRFADDFQPRVLDAMLTAENLLDPKQRTALEYALPCNVAFHRTEGLQLTPGLAEATQRFQYGAVFILDPLEWENDDERVEDPEYQRLVHQHLFEVYRELGYDPIAIPRRSPNERVELILASLGATPETLHQ